MEHDQPPLARAGHIRWVLRVVGRRQPVVVASLVPFGGVAAMEVRLHGLHVRHVDETVARVAFRAGTDLSVEATRVRTRSLDESLLAVDALREQLARLLDPPGGAPIRRQDLRPRRHRRRPAPVGGGSWRGRRGAPGRRPRD